ncbi:VOC family protein [Rhizomicrobium electricum]|jgi:uncharacterized glyoxalase superfamily protein PhnB|uniref:VOC family protein n=1 Tax=Rhizomicrobium electricum TaxID=480070 RepID=A0ABN1F9U1_9PROT|nr:VOC family protein [Rhizomicrobium electricum]NIJ50628.1 putative glyoxalase superfamily protein PhnB [Rhizomicrobium electricum]
MEDPFRRPAFTASVFYENPRAALDWLEKAFGFETVMRITDADGTLVHSEMRYSDGLLYVGAPWNQDFAAPGKTGGRNTTNLHVRVADGIEAHCETARAAGAVILQEPQEQFYGDRTYRARDPEGHIWTFAQFVRQVGREEAEKATGLKIEARDWQ